MNIPAHNGTSTSIAAAESMRDSVPYLKRRILESLSEHRLAGMTCDQLEVELELSHQTTSARIRELCEAGSIYHHGRRATRSGRQARVYFPRNA